MNTFFTSILCCALLSQVGEAAAPLFKLIPGPGENQTLMSDDVRIDFDAAIPAARSYDNEPDVNRGTPFGKSFNYDRHWNSSFKTAASNTHLFTVGWADNGNDGFISKFDPAGSVVWTKSMKEITAGTIGWRLNDIAIFGETLYVCGERTDRKGFVASLTLNGGLLEYSLIEAKSDGDVFDFDDPNDANDVFYPSGLRANSIAVTTVGGRIKVAVAGEVFGSGMQVKERLVAQPNGAPVFGDLVVNYHTSGNQRGPYSDAWVIRFENNLAPDWGTTLGMYHGHDAGTAVELDGTGAIFFALKSENPDRFGGAQMHNFDDNRKVVTRAGSISITGGTYDNYDFHPGSWSILFKLDTSDTERATPVEGFFCPTRIDSDEGHSTNRIADMAYANGQLYLTGEWSGHLRPFSNSKGAEVNSSTSWEQDDLDIWITRLDATDLEYGAFILYRSSNNDFVSGLTVSGDSVYLAGSAGGSLSQTNSILRATEAAPSRAFSLVGGESVRHLFWTKVSATDLSHQWHQSAKGPSIPSVQKTAGIGVVGNSALIVGSWSGGALTMGGDSQKTLPSPESSSRGFVGFLTKGGSWLEEVSVTINSAYGNPTPHIGVATVAAGQTISATVPTEIYEDSVGTILDPGDAVAIRQRAATRRINIGYQFRNSAVNETANSVTFVAGNDTELTFLWRTEHAIQVDSELANVEGLSSVSTGNPSPEVNKHWVEEGESFVASVNGWENDPQLDGARWRSIGFIAEGVVAEAASITSGDWFRWTNLQNRQQTPEIVVNGPGKLSWLWKREFRIRQSVNSSVAEESPTASWTDSNVLLADFEASTDIFFRNTFQDNSYQYAGYPTSVTRDQIVITFNEGAPPAKLRLRSAETFHEWRGDLVVDIPSGTGAGESVTLDFSPLKGKWFEVAGLTSLGAAASTSSSQWELRKRSETTQRTFTGVGEVWVTAGLAVTVSAPAVVDSGLSTLDLKGYYQGQGNIAPAEARNVLSRTLKLTRPSALTWDYARALYPETVLAGSSLTFSGVTGPDGGRIDTTSPPVAGNVTTGPTGSTFESMQIWDEVQKKLLVLQPGKFTVEFLNSAAPDDPAKNIIVEVTVDWPTEPNYTHIIETPPVNLDESDSDGTSFVRLAHSESRASMTGTSFSATEEGRSILLFSHRAGGQSNGDLERESLSVKVVNSISWSQSAGSALTAATIGEAITSPDHDLAAVGHNGYVIHDRAPVNADLYAREEKAGPLFPVNEVQKFGSDPIAYFPLDEASGALATERVSGTQATFFTNRSAGTPTWERPGFRAHAADVDYFKSEPAIGQVTTNRLTVAAWVKPATFVEWGGIITKGVEKAPYTLAVSDTGKLRFGSNVFNPTGSVGGGTYDSNTSLQQNVYQHVAATYDGSHLRLYLNGVLDREVAASFTMGMIEEGLTIGGDLPGGDEMFDGSIREALVYERALTSQEVASLSARAPIDEEQQLAVAWYRVQDSIRWPYKAENYEPKLPPVLDRIVIASRLGSEGLSASAGAQLLFSGTQGDPEIYHQPDPAAMGYNPNEEHALVAPSFLDPDRLAVYALRNDLNRLKTSYPFVLTQYQDLSNPTAPVARMKVYSVVEEDAGITDPRLPAFNQSYTYQYQNEAGLRLVPPYPLDLVIGSSPTPAETSGLNVDGRISYYEDKNGMPWCVSGDTDTEADILAAWYYPLRGDFWHSSAALGEAVSFGRLTSARTHNISYNTFWPADVAVLKAGETLTFSGGEYASDNSSQVPPPRGLPQAVSWQSAKQVFDEVNERLSADLMETNYLARPFSALTSHEVPLALTSVPTSLQPASGKVIVDGLRWRFRDLPASLQERIYYDTTKQVLGVRGLLNGRVLGDSDLLATPGAQTILQANVLTAEDEALVKELTSDAPWVNAVTALSSLSRDPKASGVSASLGLGLEKNESVVSPSNDLGPGIVVITNPDLQKDDALGGYITIAENDHPELPDSPVAMHVIKVEPLKYRGSIAVMEPSNIFDEKVTLRHTADFGGDVNDLFFEWIIREEDGRDLNPPNVVLPVSGTPTGSDWSPLVSGQGLYEAQLRGSGPILIRDNLVFCRYRHKDADGNNASSWSAWAGAANSRPPNSNSPSAGTDEAYVAQLVRGWIKRVVAAVNLFDARYQDFGANSAPATYTSALQQAGQRWEGPVAFNPQKDAIENVGLIELYQTVLDRGEDFTIATTPGTDGVNTALLNAANRIAGLYTLLGNEAYADALDPLIGFSSVGGEFGSLAPTIHAFENQVGDLLQEELELLRGRAEVGARPAYNRLLWNFTNGAGEAAYVLNYGLADLTNDGFIDDEDARRLYPQGHGDAWGHYTMALKGYYDLASDPNFTWSARSEKYDIDGIVLDIDYLDERTFARTAAARARCGAELVDLSYRKSYTENPNGQWQGYQDIDTDRAWGVFETAQRGGSAALCDWMFANAVLPAEERDSSRTGIRRVDRTTVAELAEIAQQGAQIQASLDAADRGLNPAGLNPEAIPFDIDPALTDRDRIDSATHFEQVFARATKASENARRTFDYADSIALQLRQTEATSETLRQQTYDQDLSLRNQMIQVFGTPYAGMIGSGKAYPEGYAGPDLYLWSYVDSILAGEGILDEVAEMTVESVLVPGLTNLAKDSNPFSDGERAVDDLLRETVNTYFPNDIALPEVAPGEVNLQLPRRVNGYALVAPESWGERRSPGEVQAAIQELVQAEWRVRSAVSLYESQADDVALILRNFELKSGIASEKIRIVRESLESNRRETLAATEAFTDWTALDHARESTLSVTGAIAEGIPSIVGLATDAPKPVVGAALTVGALVDIALRSAIGPLQVSQYRSEVAAEAVLLEMDQKLLTEDLKIELIDLLVELQEKVNSEGDLLLPIIDAVEAMRLASDRVRMIIEKGQALLEERTVFNRRVAATTTQQRYEDFTFRTFHSDSLRKYRASFDLAARYAYLAGKAYQYELNLPANHGANATPLLSEILRERSLGEWDDDEPLIGAGGLAEQLAVLQTNYESLQSQLGFNNPDREALVFSLRRELARIGLSSRVNSEWRTQLESWRVPDLWNYQYQSNGVDYGYVFRRYCRPFAPESAGAQPALVIPFTSTIESGKNWFGHPIEGGDNAFNSSNFSTKIRAVGVRLDGYNNIALSQTPQAYLVPVGADQMFLPNSNLLEKRTWNVVDQRIPAPITIRQSDLTSSSWSPGNQSSSGYFEDLRKFSSFRAYHDAGGWAQEEMMVNSRLVGRSVWNTQWVLVIPSASLLADSANPSAGIDTLIHGAPLPGQSQSTAGTVFRDQVGVRDIRLLLQTYSVSGN